MSDPILTIRLPLPPAILSPNARCHWAKKSAAVKKARKAAKLATLAAITGWEKPAPTHYTLHFSFPTALRRDDDNAAASFKSYRDGIADALGIDDHSLKMSASPEMLVNRTDPHLTVNLYV